MSEKADSWAQVRSLLMVCKRPLKLFERVTRLRITALPKKRRTYMTHERSAKQDQVAVERLGDEIAFIAQHLKEGKLRHFV